MVCHEGIVASLLVGDAALLLVFPCHIVSERVGVHGKNGLSELFVGVGLSQGVEGSLHLLVRQFLQMSVDAFQFFQGIGLSGYAVKRKTAVQSLFDDSFLDIHHQSQIIALRLHSLVNIVEQYGIFLSHAAFGIGRCEIGEQDGVAAPLGDDSFTNIPRRVIIEMGNCSDELAAPVLFPHACVPPRRELQVPMGSEMDEGVCLEAFLYIQVRC